MKRPLQLEPAGAEYHNNHQPTAERVQLYYKLPASRCQVEFERIDKNVNT